MILKKGGMLGQGVGALKKGGWNPLKNYGRKKDMDVIWALDAM